MWLTPQRISFYRAGLSAPAQQPERRVPHPPAPVGSGATGGPPPRRPRRHAEGTR